LAEFAAANVWRNPILACKNNIQEQLDFLQRHDCDQYQGFFHSRPVKADEVTRYLVSTDIHATSMVTRW